jgi:signal transduction histidine kinase
MPRLKPAKRIDHGSEKPQHTPSVSDTVSVISELLAGEKSIETPKPSYSHLVASLEQARQRIEVLQSELNDALVKLASVNHQLNAVSVKYAGLAELSSDLNVVNTTLEKANKQLLVANQSIVDAHTAGLLEAQEVERIGNKLADVNDELHHAVQKLALVEGELAEKHEYVAELEKAKLVFETVNLQVKGANQELVNLNLELEQARDLAVSESKLKAQFLANISHEIRTPMSGVISLCELLLLNNLDDDSRKIANYIERSANTLLAIVNQLLDYSKLESGKMQQEHEQFSLSAVIERVLITINHDAETKGLVINKVISPQIPACVVGDEGRVEAILLNLVHNAVKFTEHGAVTIDADVLSQSSRSVAVRVSVTDTGIGISEATQKLLFEPFVQADGSTTRKYGGTGLGLSITKRLVQLLSGEIGMISTEGKGSTFWFSLSFELPE